MVESIKKIKIKDKIIVEVDIWKRTEELVNANYYRSL